MIAMDSHLEGERRKLDAQALLAVRRAEVVRRAQGALIVALWDSATATIDDVRDAVDVPAGIDPVCLGAAPGPLARAGIIRRVGFEPSRRPAAHARPVSVWQLANRPAALRWLAEHRDPEGGEAGALPAAPVHTGSGPIGNADAGTSATLGKGLFG